MKKAYKAPTFITFGRLEELTLGLGGHSPDVLGVDNSTCLTGVVGTVTIVCTSLPS
jgi:hypothetical protein